jgi:hypothetical protein
VTHRETSFRSFEVEIELGLHPTAGWPIKGSDQSSSPTETGLSMLRTHASSTNAALARGQFIQVAKACGHTTHVGTCAACQRAQLAKWREQLAQVAH